MIIEASELSVRIDTGANAPGSILERFEGGYLAALLGGRQVANVAGQDRHAAAG